MILNRCRECLAKQQTIDRLIEENRRLKQKLRYRERSNEEGFFGSSTPSAQLPVKPNTAQVQERKKRGGQPGHPPHVRRGADLANADRIVRVPSVHQGRCPKCGKSLRSKDMQQRRVRECRPIQCEEVIYELPVERCDACKCDFYTQAPEVFPRAILGNQLLTNAVEMMYLHGIPLGRVCEQLQIQPGVLVETLHKLARLFATVPERLAAMYREAPVKHADETGWRTQGQNGYAWLFATRTMSIFRFEKTRSARVPNAVFGDRRLPGVLVVDRYGGYNKAPCAIQYCLAHLLREVQDAGKEFPESEEIKTFVATVAPLLALAQGLRSQAISDKRFKRDAAETKRAIKDAMRAPAQHSAIRRIQDIFTDNEERLYHWASDRDVPAENNLAERDLRPTVIARKTSFGSQSEAGAKTRGVLMTVIHTLKKQDAKPWKRFKEALDALARNDASDPFVLLFPGFAGGQRDSPDRRVRMATRRRKPIAKSCVAA